jgi:hypothetical protein
VGPTDRKLIPKRKAGTSTSTGNSNSVAASSIWEDNSNEGVRRKKKKRKFCISDTDTEEDEYEQTASTDQGATTVVPTSSVTLNEVNTTEEEANKFEVELDNIKKTN